MTVRLMSRWKGTAKAIVEMASELKPILEEHGAKEFHLSSIFAGPQTGQWLVEAYYDNMADCGQAMDSTMASESFRSLVAGLDTVELLSRSVLVEVKLD